MHTKPPYVPFRFILRNLFFLHIFSIVYKYSKYIFPYISLKNIFLNKLLESTGSTLFASSQNKYFTDPMLSEDQFTIFNISVIGTGAEWKKKCGCFVSLCVTLCQSERGTPPTLSLPPLLQQCPKFHIVLHCFFTFSSNFTHFVSIRKGHHQHYRYIHSIQ